MITKMSENILRYGIIFEQEKDIVSKYNYVGE